MKLYKCKILDEAFDDWEECVVAVMESMEEQKFYYDSKDHNKALETLLTNSGYEYTNEILDGYYYYQNYYIDFRFPYEMDGYPYADEIAQNVEQSVWDSWYKDFEYLSPA